MRPVDEPGRALGLKRRRLLGDGKFLSALQLIADALDAHHNTQFHSRALSCGAIALREADDFGHPDTAPAGDADPITLASSHVTPILKEAHRGSVTRLQALQLYYSYATTQFSAAVGGIPEAANAIYYLGRLQPFLGGSVERNALLAEPKALALEQAALSVDPRNYRAANELGVLLARCGQYEPARKALLAAPRSSGIRRSSKTWRTSIARWATVPTPSRCKPWLTRSAACTSADPRPRRSSSTWSITKRLPAKAR